MSLVSYSSTSSESDDENGKKSNVKRFKSELPSAKIQLNNEIDVYEKDYQTKNERSRLFPHERGNWALSIYTYGKK